MCVCIGCRDSSSPSSSSNVLFKICRSSAVINTIALPSSNLYTRRSNRAISRTLLRDWSLFTGHMPDGMLGVYVFEGWRGEGDDTKLYFDEAEILQSQLPIKLAK